MKLTSTAMFAIASSLALSACGGTTLPAGSAAGSPASLDASARRGASASAHAAGVSNPYPFAQGDSFVYAYSLTHSTKPPGKPLDKDYTTGTITTTIGGTQTFDGKQLTDVNSVFDYTNTNSTHNSTGTGTLTTDEYETFAATKSGGLDYETFGDTTSGTSSDTDGNSSVTSSTLTYGGPFLIDVLPETKSIFKEEIGYTRTADDKTTKKGVTTDDQSSFTQNADGSYTRSITRTTPGKATYQETDTQNVGGSGEDTNNGTGATGGTTTFSAPAETGGKYFITVVYTAPSEPPTTTQVPDWFPGNGPVHHLVTDEKRDLGSVTVPTKCGASAGQAGTELRETVTALDVVNGTYNFDYIDSFVVSGEGTVCIDHQRLLDTYDNLVTGDLVKAEHFNETTSLTSESLSALRSKHVILGFGATLH